MSTPMAKPRALPLPFRVLPEPSTRLPRVPLVGHRALQLVIWIRRQASPVPACEARAVVLRPTAWGRRRRRLGVRGAQRHRAAAHAVALRLLPHELAGAGDLVPYLVELPEQLHRVLLQRAPIQRAAPVAALPVLGRLRAPSPPPVLHLLRLARHGASQGGIPPLRRIEMSLDVESSRRWR
uniref:Uncharacterized protein n=1 Tax=Arundo donax TaxID=35708 RepID=A0A0A9FNG8_ARUDO